MANSLSAKKRIRQNASARARNRWRKIGYRDAIKNYDELILHGTVEQAEQQLQAIYKALDQVAGTGSIHKNTAARKKSRLATRLNHKRATAASAS